METEEKKTKKIRVETELLPVSTICNIYRMKKLDRAYLLKKYATVRKSKLGWEAILSIEKIVKVQNPTN